jgi:FkbM family methyltransferase
VQTYIYIFGVWEPAISAWLAGILRPGDTAIDVGANVGYDTLLAADRVGPGGRVRAIEASPALYRALAANLLLNDAANVDPVNAAASDRDGTLPVYLHGADNLGGTTVLPDLAAERGARFEAHVRAAPLPALVPVADLLAARAVKIDVEGAEWAVVDGIRDLLPAMRADFLVEATAQGLSAHGRTAADLVGLFEASGYRAWEIENRYDVDAYLDARPPPPRPLAGTDFEQADLLFTRRA